MIIVGYNTVPKILGYVDTFECRRCLNIVNWKLLNIENYFTLFFIPIIPTGNAYKLICESCNHEEILDKNDFTNYKIKSEIESDFLDNLITQDEKETKINEINKIILQDKERRRNKAIEGSKEWADLASEKTNEELLTIYFHERYKYNPSMIIAVESEIEKRKLKYE